MSALQCRRSPTGIFGRIGLPGPRELHFRFDRNRRPGSSSLSFHFALLSKIQPDNALELSMRRARDALNKSLGESSQNGKGGL